MKLSGSTKFFALCSMLFTITLLTSCSDNDDTPISDVPESFTSALGVLYPDARNVDWEIKHGYRVAEFKRDFCEIEVWFDKSARWVMTETDSNKDLFFLPAAVSKAFAESEYRFWEVEDIIRYQRPDIDFYVIDVETKGKPDMELYYTPEGLLFREQRDSDRDILPDTDIRIP